MEAGRVDPASGTVTGAFDEYLFEPTALDSYPETTALQSPDYTAAITVTRTPRIP